MKFRGFSRLIPAITALFGRAGIEQAKAEVSAPVQNFKISSSGGLNFIGSGLPLPPPLRTTVDNYHPIRNQRKRRKAQRRAWAAGDKFAFARKH